MLSGCDVSSRQGTVNWPAVQAAGASWAWTKLTEGTKYVNPTAGPNWHGIPAAGLVRGAYHFARADQGNSPQAEAIHFLSVLGGDISAGDILALDIEVGTGDLSSWALTWLQAVEQVAGFRPMLYSGSWWYAEHLRDPRLADYPLWFSAYPGVSREYVLAHPTYFPEQIAPPFRDWAIWQFSDSSQYDGIAGLVDDNVFRGTLDQLRALGKPGKPPVPAPVPMPAPLPSTGHYRVLTDHFLRLTPRLDAPHVALVTVGEILSAATLAPGRTTHWQPVAAPDGHAGFAFVPNLQAV